MSTRKRLVVIGNGMVGHKLLERLIATGAAAAWEVTVLGEEPRTAYDRVNLSKLFDGSSPEDLALAPPATYQEAGIAVHLGERVARIDRGARVVHSTQGRELAYDKLVIATGSYPFVPPIEGNDGPGCFVYRTIEDLDAIRAASSGAKVGVVVGGGLLGLEAANALRCLGLETHVVEFAPRLMPLQVDEFGGSILRARIEELGVHVHTSKATTAILSSPGWPTRMRFADGGELSADVIVFSAGIRPRDELARACGLAVGERGGIVIDEQCRTSDPDVYAVGECALFGGRTFGLVAPGYRMADAVAAELTGGDDRFTGADMSTKLKLMGVDVASFGDAFARTPGARTLSLLDNTSQVYKKLVISEDGKHLLGGILVGEASAYGQLLTLCQNAIA
jgi:nitrite reductase (NADH) large subunit